MLTAAQLAEYLKGQGFANAVSTGEPDMVEDGNVDVTPLVHVQVGEQYYVVGREEDEKFWFSPPRTRLSAVLADLREAIAKSGERQP
jgi:hypothetical protein